LGIAEKRKHSAPAGDGSISASPTPPDSPRIKASPAAALSSGDAESKGNSTHEDEGEDENDAYSEATISLVIVSCISASSLIPRNLSEIDWSDFKYPVPKHFVPRFREAHAITAKFHLNDDLNGQVTEGGR
jgi:hypothetical protein